jgi:hypothetical protein
VRVRDDTQQAVHNDRDLSPVCLAVASGLPGSSRSFTLVESC